MDGLIIINKEKEMTSHDVVSRLRRILKTKKVGHCGTLDPNVDGVLVCCINKGCKIASQLVLDSKVYEVTMQLGFSTTTQDLEGDIVEKKEYQNEYTIEEIKDTILSFVGKQKQIPSIYSAIKVNGKKLYEYARNNEEVEIPIRDIEIFSIDNISIENNTFKFRAHCSSGTYIRSLCFDIGAKLNYPSVMTDLRRVSSGQFNINQSYTLKQVEDNQFSHVSIEEALGLPIIVLNEKQVIDTKNGKVLSKDINSDFIVVDENNNLIALMSKSIDGYSKVIRGLF